jgi:hypothetical protein
LERVEEQRDAVLVPVDSIEVQPVARGSYRKMSSDERKPDLALS